MCLAPCRQSHCDNKDLPGMKQQPGFSGVQRCSHRWTCAGRRRMRWMRREQETYSSLVPCLIVARDVCRHRPGLLTLLPHHAPVSSLTMLVERLSLSSEIKPEKKAAAPFSPQLAASSHTNGKVVVDELWPGQHIALQVRHRCPSTFLQTLCSRRVDVFCPIVVYFRELCRS